MIVAIEKQLLERVLVVLETLPIKHPQQIEERDAVIDSVRSSLKKDAPVFAYSPKYEALFNVSDNVWIDPTCNHPACEFCNNRPQRPLDDTSDHWSLT